MSAFNTTKRAEISECGRYRYGLWRSWRSLLDTEDRTACFIMLNPSTADASVDDPTIRRCMSFAESWGCNGIAVHNLFNLRTPSPKVMMSADDPIGPKGDEMLLMLQTYDYSIYVAAWGAHGTHRNRSQEAIALINADLQCFGMTKGGQPLHPLYLPSNAALQPFTCPRNAEEARA